MSRLEIGIRSRGKELYSTRRLVEAVRSCDSRPGPRDEFAILSPKGGEDVMVGNELLCFGKCLTLRGLVVRRPRKKRRRAAGSGN